MRGMTSFRIALPLFGVLSFLAIGCADTKHDNHDRHHGDRDVSIDRHDRARDDDVVVVDRSRDHAWDTTHRGLDEVPRQAVRVGRRDESTPGLYVRPNREGRIYVYSEEGDRVIYSGRLHRHEEFVADPDRDVITIEGKRVSGVRFRKGDHYRLYWLPD